MAAEFSLRLRRTHREPLRWQRGWRTGLPDNDACCHLAQLLKEFVFFNYGLWQSLRRDQHAERNWQTIAGALVSLLAGREIHGHIRSRAT